MAWIAINDPRFNAASAPVEPKVPVSTRFDTSSTSKFRVNVLAASESIVSARPKRTKVSKRDNPPLCNIGKRIQKQTTLLQEERQISNQDAGSLNAPIENPQSEQVSKKAKIEKHCPSSSISELGVDNGRQECQLSTHQGLAEPKQPSANDLLNSCDLCEYELEIDTHWSAQSPRDELDGGLTQESDMKEEERLSNARSAVLGRAVRSTHSTPIVIESSDGDRDEFGNFDDSVFDQLRLPELSDLVSSKSKYSETRPLFAYGFNKISPAQSVSEPQQHKNRPAYPNEAPFPPFMHPNVDHSMHAICGGRPLPNSASDGKVLTCFRVAEAVRVIAAFRSNRWKAQKEIRLVLFATIKEMKYANSLGQGQGLVLSDISFAHQPPYLTPSCKIPYNVDYLIPKTKGKAKPPVQTFLSVSEAKRSKHGQSVPTVSPPSSLVTRSESPNQRSVEVEVLDVKLSSWEEIKQAKELVEREYQVRKTPKDKDTPQLFDGPGYEDSSEPTWRSESSNGDARNENFAEVLDDFFELIDDDEYP